MYRTYTSFELLQKICTNADKKALDELLAQRRIYFYENRRLLFSEYLWKLKENYRRRNISINNVDEFSDSIYDLTLAKFVNFPVLKSATNRREKAMLSALKHAGLTAAIIIYPY